MGGNITSARVRELGAKATGGFYEAHGSSVRHYPSTSPLAHPRLVASCHWNEDAALIAALCSEPARNRIADALDLLERVERQDAGLVAKMEEAILSEPLTALGNGEYCDPPAHKVAAAALAALVGRS